MHAIENLYGKPGLERVLAALPGDVRDALATILPVQRYPVRYSALSHQALRDTIGKGTSWAPSHAVGVEAASIDFKGLYRILLRAVSYDTVWNRMETAWGQYNSMGRIEWRDRRPGFAVGTVSGVEDYNMGMWQSVAGRAEGLLTLSGAKGATSRVLDGDSRSCRIEISWAP